MRQVIPLFFLVLFVFFVREGVCLDTAPQIGKLAPAFELSDVNGEKVALSVYKGKVVLINFWATFCGPCKKEMPSLNKLFLAFKKEGLIILAISIDSSDKPVRKFLKDRLTAHPVLLDFDQEVYFDLYGILGLPTSVLIDRAGVIREIIRGERVWDAPDMKEKIGKLLTKNKKEKT